MEQFCAYNKENSQVKKWKVVWFNQTTFPAKKKLAQKTKKMRQNREFRNFLNKGGCPSLV